MGFFFTLLYLCVSLLSPATLVPGLAEYRIEVILAVLALIFSLPRVLTSNFLRTPQVYILIGMLAAVFLSQAVGNHWLGGGVAALQEFLKAAIVFFLIILNVRALPPLKIIVASLAAVSVYFVFMGAQAYMTADSASPFILMHPGPLGIKFIRIRGLGCVNDPNDLAQFLIAVIPLLWVNWERGRAIHNSFCVTLPAMVMAIGLFLTHSRGGLIALLVIMVFGLKDRLGAVSSTIIAAAMGAALLALNFSGGRDVSMESGSDRMGAWSAGLQFFKSSPLLGIGFGTFADQNFGLTAHNSFVLCLAELGIFGYTLWMALLIFTFSGLNAIIAASQRGAMEPDGIIGNESVAAHDLAGADERALLRNSIDGEDEHSSGQQQELHRWAKLIRTSLVGFLAAGWFLSRTYVMTLYMLLGMAAALIALASKDNESLELPASSRLFVWTAGADLASIAFLYAWLRARALF